MSVMTFPSFGVDEKGIFCNTELTGYYFKNYKVFSYVIQRDNDLYVLSKIDGEEIRTTENFISWRYHKLDRQTLVLTVDWGYLLGKKNHKCE